MNNSIEAIVRRLFSDGEFRKATIEDAGVTLDQYNLTEVERRSVTRLCQSLATAGGPSMSQSNSVLTWY